MTMQHFLRPVMQMQIPERWIHFLPKIMITKMSQQIQQFMKKFFRQKNQNDEQVFLLIFVPFQKIQRKTEAIESKKNSSISSISSVPDTSSTSANTTQEESALLPPCANSRQSKHVRSQATSEQKSKPSIARKTRREFTYEYLTLLHFLRGILVNRTRSEDRFRGSSLSLLSNTGDTTSSSSQSQLPSYAAHTSSSMNKLREGSTSSTPPPTAPIQNPSPSSTTSSQTRRPPTAISFDSRSLSTKNIPKSRSTQNLILPATNVSNSNTQQSKVSQPYRTRVPRLPRRPPNLPTAANIPSSSTSSSSSSSSTSSPTKSKQHLSPTLPESTVPLRELNDSNTTDLMPKWAQDCFYRTVVLGLKPLLLQDVPPSPSKHSTSSSSLESSDSIETTSELLTNQKEIQVRRSISIPDYKQIEAVKNNDK